MLRHFARCGPTRYATWLALAVIVSIAGPTFAEDSWEKVFTGSTGGDFSRNLLPMPQRNQVAWESLLRPHIEQQTIKTHVIPIRQRGRLTMTTRVSSSHGYAISAEIPEENGKRRKFSWHEGPNSAGSTYTPEVWPGDLVFTVKPGSQSFSNPDYIRVFPLSYEIRVRWEAPPPPRSAPVTPPPRPSTPRPTSTSSTPKPAVTTPPTRVPPPQATPPRQPPPAVTPTAPTPPPTMPEATSVPTGDESGDAAAAGAGAAAAGLLTALGAWAMMQSSGVRLRDIQDSLQEWLRTAPATPPTPPPARGRDGEVNEFGEVWSDEDGGWIGRNLYEQERARRTHLAAKAEADLHAGQSDDVREAYERWQASQDKLQKLRLQGQRWQAETFLKNKLDELMAAEQKMGADETRRAFLERLQQKASGIGAMEDDAQAIQELTRLGGTVLRQKEPGFKPTYTYSDAIFDTTVQTSAAALDFAVTRGIASAAVNAGIAARTTARAGGEIGEIATAAATSATRDYLFGKAAGYAGQGIGKAWRWFRGDKIAGPAIPKLPSPQAGREAMARAAEERAMAKLPADHPARQIGQINESLSKAKGFDPRLVNATRRLDPADAAYQKAIDALKARSQRGAEYDRLLRPEAKKAMDAVRHDMDLRSRERALEMLYKEHPECRGKITGFDNTGSHARKGVNYRGLDSDVDHTPCHDGTLQGRQAAEKFGDYQERALREMSGDKVGMQDLKINSYGNNQGAGAFQSKTGLKVKDLYDQGSGRIDVVQGDRITHHLRGADPVEKGVWTRWSTGNTAGDRTQVQSLCGDYLQKFKAEQPMMGGATEELKQAAKAYYNCRVFEAKSMGGRALDADAALIAQAKEIKALATGMNDAEKAELAQKFLNELKNTAFGS